MPELTETLNRLTTGAQRIAQAAMEKQKLSGQTQLCLKHWLLALLERHGPMVESMSSGIHAENLHSSLESELKGNQPGEPLDLETLVKQAEESARARGKSQPNERDVASVLLALAGLSSGESQPAAETTGGSKVASATPTLDAFGRDLTRAAREGKLSPIVGRQEEIDLMLETLCRQTKRNPVLVGPAGVGKTAIVEGLAQRVVEGSVPEFLKTMRLIALQPSNLVAGSQYHGEMEQRMKAVIGEAAQSNIILFIDEVHSIIGAGGPAGSADIASMLKPALARGDIAVIAATTDDEYRRFVETDSALERRFQPIRVQEPNASQTLDILLVMRDNLEKKKGVRAHDDVLNFLVEFGQAFMRNRRFPDKAVDLLEQCIAYGVTRGRKEISLQDAQSVAQRMVGMPLALEERLNGLKERLAAQVILNDEDSAALLNRLQVTLRGLDLRNTRPNCVILLAGEAAGVSERLGAAIAGALFGAEDRVTLIDLSTMSDRHALTALLGAPPSYVGYSDSLPIHRILQMPWSVLRLEAIHACHPAILEVILNALEDGFFTDAQGKKIFLSDTVVLLSAEVELETHRRLGFGALGEKPPEADRKAALAQTFGHELVEQMDLVITSITPSAGNRRKWLENKVLAGVSELYLKQGVQLRWDASLVDWLLVHEEIYANQRDWERFVDEKISPVLIQHLPEHWARNPVELHVKFDGDAILVEK